MKPSDSLNFKVKIYFHPEVRKGVELKKREGKTLGCGNEGGSVRIIWNYLGTAKWKLV